MLNNEKMSHTEALAIINSYQGLLPCEVAKQRQIKLRATYNASGLCSTEYNELVKLDEALKTINY